MRGFDWHQQRILDTASAFGLTIDQYKSLPLKERRKLNLLRDEKAYEYGIDLEIWRSLPEQLRSTTIPIRYKRGIRDPEELIRSSDRGRRVKDENIHKALEKYQVSEEVWSAFTDKQKRAIAVRYKRGKRGKDLFDFERTASEIRSESRSRTAATKYGIPYESYQKLSKNQRAGVIQRYNRGVRGALELCKGYLDAE